MHIAPLLLIAGLVPTESWECPNPSGTAAATTRLGDSVVATSFTNEYDDSFDSVARWYAKRTGFASLKTKLDAYRNRSSGDPDFSAGTSATMKIDGGNVANGTVLFNFSPKHMHAMIVFAAKPTGEIISISIAGDDQFATVNLVRRPTRDKKSD